MPGIPISRGAFVAFECDRRRERDHGAVDGCPREGHEGGRGRMSRRQAAARFDIGPATAVRWTKRVETAGEVAPLKMGGDRRSQRMLL